MTYAAGLEAAADLLPCPFCGGDAALFQIGDDEPANAGGLVVHCTKCDACSRVQFSLKEDARPLVIEAWNTRTLIASAPQTQPGEPNSEIMRCNICGFVVDTRYEAEKPSIDFGTAGRAKKGRRAFPPPEWQPINTRPDADDEMWFARHDGNSWIVDGPRGAQGDDADYWTLWAPCEAPSLPTPPDGGDREATKGS